MIRSPYVPTVPRLCILQLRRAGTAPHVPPLSLSCEACSRGRGDDPVPMCPHHSYAVRPGMQILFSLRITFLRITFHGKDSLLCKPLEEKY